MSGPTLFDADVIATGTVDTARLGSGTADASSYLRGDQTWAAISVGVAWGDITGALANQTDLQSALDAKAATSHTHVQSQITDMTTASTVAFTGVNCVTVQNAAGVMTIGNSTYGVTSPGTLLAPNLRLGGAGAYPFGTTNYIGFSGGTYIAEQSGATPRMLFQPNGDRFEILDEAGNNVLFAVRGANSALPSRVMLYNGMIIGSGTYLTTTPPTRGAMIEGNVLVGTFTDNGVNKLQCAGSATFTGAVSVGPITYAVLNALTATATLGVYRITDRANKLAYPDGTNWRFVGDDAIIS